MSRDIENDLQKDTYSLDAADSTRNYCRRVNAIPLLSADREKVLSRRIRRGDQEARIKMIEANLRLVVNIARMFIRMTEGTSLTIADLIQEGNIGLIHAVKKFNGDKGYRFSTIATYWIRQAVTRAIADQGRKIRLPVHIVEAIQQYSKTCALFLQKHGYAPTVAEISLHLGWSEQKTQELMNDIPDATSLDVIVYEEGETTIGDYVVDWISKSPEEVAFDADLRAELKVLFTQVLSDREQTIMELRYGLDGQGCRTLEDTGRIFQISRERVRQIQVSALNKLRNQNRRKRQKT